MWAGTMIREGCPIRGRRIKPTYVWDSDESWFLAFEEDLYNAGPLY